MINRFMIVYDHSGFSGGRDRRLYCLGENPGATQVSPLQLRRVARADTQVRPYRSSPYTGRPETAALALHRLQLTRTGLNLTALEPLLFPFPFGRGPGWGLLGPSPGLHLFFWKGAGLARPRRGEGRPGNRLVNGGLDSRLRGNDGPNYASFLRKKESISIDPMEKDGKYRRSLLVYEAPNSW